MSSRKSPKASVLMPVYNGEQYLREAVESILNQTFTDFEFVIINDGSTDRSREIIESYDDQRIRLFNQENKKLVASLNRGIAEARGELIARQDADDASLPDRLEKQVAFLKKHPEVALVGTCFDLVDEAGNVVFTEYTPSRDIDIRRGIFLENPFGHGTVMTRKKVVEEAGGYRDDFRHNEDLDLWRRILKSHQAANLPEILYRWRVNPEGISQLNTAAQTEDQRALRESLWQDLKFPNLSMPKIIAGARYYRGFSGPFKQGLYKEYLRDQYRLALLLFRRGKWGAGLTNLVGAVLADPVIAAYFLLKSGRRTAGRTKRRIWKVFS